MLAREQAVVEMGGSQHHSAADRKYAVSHYAERVVCDGRPDAEQDEPRNCAKHNAHIAVPGETGTDGHYTQGYHDDQHLHVQVSCSKWQQDRQRAHDEGQCQAMHEAQTRQSDGRAVEPVRRFRGCLIHPEMPLC